MALAEQNLGKVESNCPDGFTRYDQNSELVSFTGMTQIRSWGRFGTSKTDSFVFYTEGCKYIRFVSLTESACGVQNVYINDELSDRRYYSNFKRYEETMNLTNGYNAVCCELDLTTKFNKIEVKNDGQYTSQINFSYIEVITEEGSLISEDDYLKGIKALCLIKDDNGYWGYSDGALVSVADYQMVFETVNSCLIDDFAEVLPLISSLTNPKIVTDKQCDFIIEGLKTDNEVVVSKHIKSLAFAEQVNSLSIEGEGIIKVVFSLDEGTTWNYYDGETVQTLEHTFDKTKGIDSEENVLFKQDVVAHSFDISTINYDIFKDRTVEFAFLISGYGVVKGVNISYKVEDSYKVLGDSDITIEKVLGKYIKLIPHKNIDSAILEILTTGVLEEEGTTS